MAKAKQSGIKLRPATSPEERETRLIDLALQNAEEKLLNGTASSQLICHFLKLGSQKAELENEKLKAENSLLLAKVENLKAQTHSEELMNHALQAFAKYSGAVGDEDEEL